MDYRRKLENKLSNDSRGVWGLKQITNYSSTAPEVTILDFLIA